MTETTSEYPNPDVEPTDPDEGPVVDEPAEDEEK